MKRRILGSAAVLLMLSLVFWAECMAQEAVQEHPEYTVMRRVTTEFFSTASMLMVYDDFSQPERQEAFEQTWEDVCALLEEIDAALSLSRTDSDVNRFNALASGENVSVGQHTLNVLDAARNIHARSGGAYDPTVSRLVDLYGFSPRFTAVGYESSSQPYDRESIEGGRGFPPPDRMYMEGFVTLVSLPSIESSGNLLTKRVQSAEIAGTRYEQTIDLGGIGKGYAVDCVMSLLRQRGYAYGYFSCGGSSVGVLRRAVASTGAPEPAQWGVAIVKPRFATQSEQTLMRVFLRDKTLSTSGDYEHVYMHDGVRYSHLIDPATGEPINMPRDGIQSGICSATVFGESAAKCDALSTALCALGLEDALELMNRPEMSDYRFVLVLYSGDSAYCEVVTNLSETEYQLLDAERFRLACEVENGVVSYTGSLMTQTVTQ